MSDQVTASPLLGEYTNAIHDVTVAFRGMHAGKVHFGVKQCWYQPANSAKAIPAQVVGHKQHEAGVALDYQTELNKATAKFTAEHPQFTWFYTGATVKTIPPEKAVKPIGTPVSDTAVYKPPVKA